MNKPLEGDSSIFQNPANLAATHSNAPKVLSEAAAVYKVNTDVIATKVKQDFAAKEKTQTAKKTVAKSQPKVVKKAKAA